MNSNTVFLDRDGILIEDHGYVYKKEDLQLLPGVKQGLAKLKSEGFRLVVVSNQSGIARGKFTEKDVHIFHEALNTEVENSIDAFYYCPHHVDGTIPEFTRGCDCRKPGILMFETDKKIAPFTNAIMVGDKSSDIEFAKNAGIPGVFIESRYGSCNEADYQAANFTEAVETILNHFSRT